jgi:hypothetical protein
VRAWHDHDDHDHDVDDDIVDDVYNHLADSDDGDLGHIDPVRHHDHRRDIHDTNDHHESR